VVKAVEAAEPGGYIEVDLPDEFTPDHPEQKP